MSVTQGFINTSMQTPKIKQQKQEETLELILHMYSASVCQRWNLLITPRMSSPLRCTARDVRGGYRGYRFAHLQHKLNEHIVNVWEDGRPTHGVMLAKIWEIPSVLQIQT